MEELNLGIIFQKKSTSFSNHWNNEIKSSKLYNREHHLFTVCQIWLIRIPLYSFNQLLRIESVWDNSLLLYLLMLENSLSIRANRTGVMTMSFPRSSPNKKRMSGHYIIQDGGAFDYQGIVFECNIRDFRRILVMGV